VFRTAAVNEIDLKTMASDHPPKLIPVLRRPRREWQIPSIESPEAELERLQYEAQLKALREGTTAYGREIFRRILGLASKKVEENKSSLEAVREVAEELGTYSELHHEFILLLGRTLEMDPNEVRQASPRAWAFQIVLRARLIQRLNEEATENEG
jgi:hypothetical protein